MRNNGVPHIYKNAYLNQKPKLFHRVPHICVNFKFKVLLTSEAVPVDKRSGPVDKQFIKFTYYDETSGKKFINT